MLLVFKQAVFSRSPVVAVAVARVMLNTDENHMIEHGVDVNVITSLYSSVGRACAP